MDKYLKIINGLISKNKMSIYEVADTIGVERNTVYLYTDRLEDVGLIEKFQEEKRDRKGRPAKYIRFTQKAIEIQ